MVRLKPLREQVILITGASSGIGLATARMAAERGAKVVLCSRNREELEKIASDIEARGGEALAVELDVTNAEAVERAAQTAIEHFGRIDTWVNNAGVSIYGKLAATKLDEKRRVFDVNFWGVVHGCRTAVKVLRDNGGAIINLGSVLSERAIPIQGIYSASKHAVKAYTDCLRMELEAEGSKIAVTLIKPAAIDTPYTEHALNHLDHKPVHTAPVYAPEIVANAILECAQSQHRDIFVGGSAKIYSLLETWAPRFLDLMMEKTMMEDGQSNKKQDWVKQRPALRRHPSKEGETRGSYDGHVMESSVFTSASLHPLRTALIATGIGAVAAVGIGYALSRKKANLSSTASPGKETRNLQ
jgi:short-subunit dehydrogenase